MKRHGTPREEFQFHFQSHMLQTSEMMRANASLLNELSNCFGMTARARSFGYPLP